MPLQNVYKVFKAYLPYILGSSLHKQFVTLSVLKWLIACFAHLEKLLERIATMKALKGSQQKKRSSCY